MSECKTNLADLSLPVVGQETDTVDCLVRLGKALSDPIRVRMLQLMARGRGCCGLPPSSTFAATETGDCEGICVCEFQELYGLGQSKVSYHLKVLREAGLIKEEVRGKWTFYSLDARFLKNLLEMIGAQLHL